MNPRLWRAIMLPVILVASLFVNFGWAVQVAHETFGLNYTQNWSGLHITSVDPGSPAAAARIHAGDSIEFVKRDLISVATFLYPSPGAHVPILVNGHRTVTLVAGRARPASTRWNTFDIVRLAFLLVAAVLAWRRPDDKATRALVAFLFAFGFAIALANNAFGSPLVSFIVMNLFPISLFLYAVGAAARFAAIYPSGNAPRAANALSAAAMIVSWFGICVYALGSLWTPNPEAALFASAVVIACLAISVALLTVTLIERYVHAEPSERRRRLWIFLILGSGMVGPTIGAAIEFTRGPNPLIDALAILPVTMMPVGLAYVILRHQLIDLNFVLNRAAVYTVMSIVIVGVFVIVETLLARYVETHSHLTSTALQLAVALALGLSIRAIHARADRFVDMLLFRRRHEAEAAIRNFAHDAPYITDRSVLLHRSLEMAIRYGGATAAGLWVRQADGTYEPAETNFVNASAVDENDPAVLTMRSRRVVADVVECRSTLPGMLAFPMIVRGELVGMLVCAGKRNDEPYAPDERNALEAMASAVGHSLDALEVRELRQTLRRLQQQPYGVLGRL